MYIAFSIVFIALVAWFSVNWFDLPRVLPNNFGWTRGSDLFDLLMFAGLTVTIAFPLSTSVLPWIVAGRMRAEVVPTATPTPVRVAMITTYVPGAEPLALLESTLRSMLAVRDLPGWKHDTWVLDEGDSPAVFALAKRLGVHYFTRAGVPELNTIGGRFAARTKGGNHNAWYHEVGFEWYDIVSQWDTDFQLRPEALERILPHFADERVGWVGTPQIYANTESFVARGAAEQAYQFYGSFNRGLSSDGHCMMLGANHTVRVAALREIGGYEAHLTEDLATGTALHSRGWRSRYVAEPLAYGEGPTTLNAYFKQQFRWAKGCVDLLVTSTWRKAVHMPRGLALMYLWLQQFYFTGAAFGIGLVLMTLNFGFGWEGTRLPLLPFVESYLPLVLMNEVMQWWLQRFNVRPGVERGLYLRGRVMGALAVPVYLFANVAAIRDRGRHTVFEVTPKAGSFEVRIKRRGSASVFRPHVAVTAVSSLGMEAAVVLGHVDVVNFFWASLVTVSGVGLAAAVNGERVVAGARRGLTRVRIPALPVPAIRQETVVVLGPAPRRPIAQAALRSVQRPAAAVAIETAPGRRAA